VNVSESDIQVHNDSLVIVSVLQMLSSISASQSTTWILQWSIFQLIAVYT